VAGAGAAPHTLPEAAQVLPQSTALPQLSSITPQCPTQMLGSREQPQKLAPADPPPQVSPRPVHGPPHDTGGPQPFETVPQVAPAGHTGGVQHRLAWQICPTPQPSHVVVVPQLFTTVPHLPLQVLGLGVQPQTLGVPPPPQLCPVALHCVVPQSTIRPQLSATIPHLPLQVAAADTEVQPHMLGTPPPLHVAGAVQLFPPHEIVPPQLSGMLPQVLPLGQAASLVQPQTLGVPPPPQV
jgi:hypothetical protein